MGNIILNNLYKVVDTKLKGKESKFTEVVSKFIQKNHEKLYYYAPSYRIYYTNEDKDDLYNFLGLTENEVLDLIKDAYYFKQKNFNPRAMKDPTTILILLIFRYFYINKKPMKSVLIYLCFSPKIYLSIHSGQFPQFAPCDSEKYMAIMDYTISNISNKYEIKKKGNLCEAVLSTAEFWAKTYDSKIKKSSDEDLVYIFQQLHNRIKQSLIALSREYYKNLNDPKALLLYSSDRHDEDSFRLSDSNYMVIAQNVSTTMNHLLSSEADIKLCKAISGDITALELKSLVETIISNKDNIESLNVIISNVISNYYSECTSNKKDVRDISFINYSLTRKSNSVNKEYNELISNVRKLLSENSERYVKRRNRPATEAAYIRALLGYIILVINKSNS